MTFPLGAQLAKALSPEQIAGLLKVDKAIQRSGVLERKTPPQTGPIRWYDKEMRCASRGCGSPTYIKFDGVPYCGMHTLRLANERLQQH